jgi:hypothetical protein
MGAKKEDGPLQTGLCGSFIRQKSGKQREIDGLEGIDLLTVQGVSHIGKKKSVPSGEGYAVFVKR